MCLDTVLPSVREAQKWATIVAHEQTSRTEMNARATAIHQAKKNPKTAK